LGLAVGVGAKISYCSTAEAQTIAYLLRIKVRLLQERLVQFMIGRYIKDQPYIEEYKITTLPLLMMVI
jgi:hypothetical protein